MFSKIAIGTAIAAAAIGAAAPASADAGNPFSHLCLTSQCSDPAPVAVHHGDGPQVQSSLKQGMQAALSARN
jgi:hypothetical protein